MNKQRMIEWIGTHDVGVSSKTMWCGLMGVGSSENMIRFDVPHDPDDFSRCYDLVTFAEVSIHELHRVCDIFPWYKPVIDRWDELSKLYEDKDYTRLYQLLSKTIHGEVMHLQGYEERAPGVWTKNK